MNGRRVHRDYIYNKKYSYFLITFGLAFPNYTFNITNEKVFDLVLF